MIGSMIPEGDSHWNNFLLLLRIIDYIFAPVSSDDIIPYIEELINEHHTQFSSLYPNSPIIPKMHYMIHIPEWISRYMHIKIMASLILHIMCM